VCSRVEVGGVYCTPSTLEATTNADLGLLLISDFVGDYLLLQWQHNAVRSVTAARSQRSPGSPVI
jgi:hypothetical protein